jgi:PAS domain S-box-containing protein
MSVEATDGRATRTAETAHALEPDARAAELVAHLGHELKTPLAVVLGLCGRLLAAGGLRPAEANDIRGIRAASYTLLERVEELLHVARLGSGRLTLETRRVDVAALVRDSVEGFRPVAESRRQRLVVETPARLYAEVDDDKLVTVLSNLIVNALKFTPTGGLVRCTVGARRGRIRLEVADSGPGVPPALREAVFERYRRTREGSVAAKGSGLGLAIVRELVAVHGGTVAIQDAPEGGALLVVEVAGRLAPVPAETPLAVNVVEHQRPAVERLEADLAAGRRRIPDPPAPDRPAAMVVTADAQLGALVAELIGGQFTVTHAYCPATAIRALATGVPDAIVLDAASGPGAVASIRRRHRAAPLLALAAGPEDVAELLAAGADDCVTKPFAAAELQGRLAALAARGCPAGAGAAAVAGLDRAFSASPMPMAVLSVSGRVVRANAALRGLLGHGSREPVGRPVGDLLHPDDRTVERDRRELLVRERVLTDRRLRRLAHADGSYVPARVTAVLADDDAGRGLCVVWFVEPRPVDLISLAAG